MKRIVLAVTLGLVALVGVAVALPSSSPGEGRPWGFTLEARIDDATSFTTVDVDGSGSVESNARLSVGDTVIGRLPLVLRSGRAVGTYTVTETLVQPGGGEIRSELGWIRQVVGVYELERGQITVQGVQRNAPTDPGEEPDAYDPGPYEFAITGGTGAYRGVRGEVVQSRIVPGPEPGQSRRVDVLRFTR